MSEASAKVRLSNNVASEDADMAIRLMNWMLDKIMRDRETGRYDSDIVATGKPKSQVDKINTITGIIRELQKEFDQVEINKVVEEAKTFNIDEVASRRIIDELVYKGELYKVRHGFIKLVEQV
jgi:replicative DNA helicase Mcm